MHFWSVITETNKPKTWSASNMLRQLSQYFLCTGLGLLSGAIGTTLVIGVAIVIQAMQSPAVIFSPNIVLFAGAATLPALGVAWLISRVAHRFSPTLSAYSEEHRVQIIMICAALTSLLETFLLVHSL